MASPGSRKQFRIGHAVAASLFAGLVAALLCALILFGGAIQAAVLNYLEIDPILTPLAGWWKVFSQAMRYIVAFGATSSLIAIIYYYGPYRKQR